MKLHVTSLPMDAALAQRWVDHAKQSGQRDADCNAEHVRWQHVDNPAGASQVVFVESDDAIVASAVWQRRLFRRDDVEVRVAMLAAFDARGVKRPAPAAELILEAAREMGGVDAVLAVVPDAEASILATAGMTRTFRVDTFATPVRLANIVENQIGSRTSWLDGLVSVPLQAAAWLGLNGLAAVSRLRFTDTPPAPAAFDAMVERSLSPQLLAADRRFDFHRWHFLSSPHVRYIVKYLRKGSALVGTVACRVAEINRLRCLLVEDVLCDASLSEPDLLRVLLNISDTCRRENCDAVVAQLNAATSAGRAVCRLPLLKIPEGLIPPIDLQLLHSSGKLDVAAVGKTHLAFSAADFR